MMLLELIHSKSREFMDAYKSPYLTFLRKHQISCLLFSLIISFIVIVTDGQSMRTVPANFLGAYLFVCVISIIPSILFYYFTRNILSDLFLTFLSMLFCGGVYLMLILVSGGVSNSSQSRLVVFVLGSVYGAIFSLVIRHKKR